MKEERGHRCASQAYIGSSSRQRKERRQIPEHSPRHDMSRCRHPLHSTQATPSPLSEPPLSHLSVCVLELEHLGEAPGQRAPDAVGVELQRPPQLLHQLAGLLRKEKKGRGRDEEIERDEERGGGGGERGFGFGRGGFRRCGKDQLLAACWLAGLRAKGKDVCVCACVCVCVCVCVCACVHSPPG